MKKLPKSLKEFELCLFNNYMETNQENIVYLQESIK